MSKYSKPAQQTIKKTMEEFADGKLKIGNTDKKVRKRSQAIAIGIDKARRKGQKVPGQK